MTAAKGADKTVSVSFGSTTRIPIIGDTFGCYTIANVGAKKTLSIRNDDFLCEQSFRGLLKKGEENFTAVTDRP